MFGINFFFKGILLGFCIAAPVGPMGLLCIKRTLNAGRLSGWISGAGAAVADGLFGMVAGFGLSAISNFLINIESWLGLLGGLFLLFLGIKTFFEKPPKEMKISYSGLFNDFSSSLFLAITNPITIIAFVSSFTGLGITNNIQNPIQSTILVTGVFLGSSAWWLMLSEGVSLFRHRISKKFLSWINKGAGILIFLFGIGIMIKAVRAFLIN